MSTVRRGIPRPSGASAAGSRGYWTQFRVALLILRLIPAFVRFGWQLWWIRRRTHRRQNGLWEKENNDAVHFNQF